MLWKECIARTSTTRLGILGRVALLLLIGLTFVIHGLVYYQEIENYHRLPTYTSHGEALIFSTMLITALFGAGIVLLAGLRAAGLIANEKEHDCWISLLSTPLSPHEVIWGKLWGNLYAFRWMVLPLGVIWLMQITLSPHYVIAVPFNLWALGATIMFATAVGLSFSLRFASSVKAIGATLSTLLFVGGGYMFCCCLPMFFAAGPDGEEAMLMFIACIPFLQGAPSPLVFFTVQGEMSDDEFAFAAIDYLFGTVGYAIAATVITAGLVANFDRIVGRVTGDRQRRPMATPSLPPSPPEEQVPTPVD